MANFIDHFIHVEAYYPNDLYQAVNAQMRQNYTYAGQINAAVQQKNKSWLNQLLTWVAQQIFGSVLDNVVSAVRKMLLGF